MQIAERVRARGSRMSPNLKTDTPEDDNRLRVIIADDVNVTRNSTRLMMTLVPDVKVVAIAGNGRQAVEMARKTAPDIALMDVNMPEMNGLDAINTMMESFPDLAFVVLSAEQDSDTLRRAVEAGARGYLIKPFTAEQLVTTVKRVVTEVREKKSQRAQQQRVSQERNSYLNKLARSYKRSRRTDDEAVELFEELASDSTCDVRWLRHLAVLYVLRGDWAKLRELADRLDKWTK
jgi:YesN/AraC family two-component response regulator